ncbi:MAG TPA: NlpC/P60 family protein [Candidatus Nanopelagicales bacterium]
MALIPTTALLTGSLAIGLLVAGPASAATAADATTTAVATAPVAVIRTAAAADVARTAAVAKAAAAKAAAARAAAVRAAAVKAAAARAAAVRAVAARQAAVRSKVVRLALSRVGHSRYVAGAAGPTRFDCSGLALWAWRLGAGKRLPHYSKAQAQVTRHVARANLRPGDLVFFFRHGAHHVAIYIGGGRMVGAANPRAGIRVDYVFRGWYGAHYSGAGRLF